MRLLTEDPLRDVIGLHRFTASRELGSLGPPVGLLWQSNDVPAQPVVLSASARWHAWALQVPGQKAVTQAEKLREHTLEERVMPGRESHEVWVTAKGQGVIWKQDNGMGDSALTYTQSPHSGVYRGRVLTALVWLPLKSPLPPPALWGCCL